MHLRADLQARTNDYGSFAEASGRRPRGLSDVPHFSKAISPPISSASAGCGGVTFFGGLGEE